MSAIQDVFRISELLSAILSKLPSAQLARTARVNRRWFFSSIPILWREMCLRQAFTPLGSYGLANNCLVRYPTPPITLLFSHQRNQSELPTQAQWERFLMYSTYVRAIAGCGYDLRIISVAIRSRPSSMDYLFPNLRSLEWHTILIENLSEFNLLITPTLQNFTLNLLDFRLPSFQLLCEILCDRLKILQFLVLGFNPPRQDRTKCIESFSQILRACRSTLIHVQMPEACNTEETIGELLKMSNLRDLLIRTSFDLLFDDNYSVGRKWSYHVEYDGKEGENFGSLDNLLFTGSQQTFSDVFLNRFTLSSLRVLTWYRCMELDDPHSFASTIATACPQLKTLTLGDSEMFTSEDLLPPIISWSTIRILLKCKLLTGLSLHCCRVIMTPEELLELLTSRRDSMATRWEVLEIYTADPLSICDLLLFLKHCPYLSKLGVHLDGRYFGDTVINEARSLFDASDTLPKSPGSIIPQHTCQNESVEYKNSNGFPSLEVIDFAYSPLDSDLIPDFAFFLLGICERKPIICGWEWEDVGNYIWEAFRVD
ncbi:hypothetical protein Clacol_007888 [Clathrus columnatus]|uniref:F-box domain-containing protein n=1 Tax=Clathrus columnatus TaxID=1419009 RepID=A0AAV5AIW1_9AGAM|nr:hypothetical protein Clacol_007888 [Clathrus columnatus]